MGRLKRREFLRRTAVGAAGAGVLGACGGAAEEVASGEPAVSGPSVTWRIASSFPRSADILAGAPEEVGRRMAALTGGRFQIRSYPAGELVPALQVFDAVQQGTVQAGYTPGYYYTGKHPALAFDTGVPFGLNSRQQNAWLYHGGGSELMQQILEPFGMTVFPCGNTGAQMGGWFRQPVDSLADLRGLTMRIPGLGGEIMSRLGVTVQVLAPGDIYPALERGAIDASEWVGPYDDLKAGLFEIAPYYYYPGWWEPGATVSLFVNRRAWNALPEAYQELLRTVTREVNQDVLARYDVANPQALATLVDEHGVQLRSFSDEILEACREEADRVLGEVAEGNADFARVYEQWDEFRRRSFEYFAGNELRYASFAFPGIGTTT